MPDPDTYAATRLSLRYHPADLEWTPYPLSCSYVSPGRWHHLALSFSAHGGATLYQDGRLCTKSRAAVSPALSGGAELEQVRDLPCDIGREAGQSLVIGGVIPCDIRRKGV